MSKFEQVQFKDVPVGGEFRFLNRKMIRVQETVLVDGSSVNAVYLAREKAAGTMIHLGPDRWVEQERNILHFRLRGV